MATVVSIISKHDLRIEVHYKEQTNKTNLSAIQYTGSLLHDFIMVSFNLKYQTSSISCYLY